MREVIMQPALAFGFLGLVGATIDYTYSLLKKLLKLTAEAAAAVICMPFVLPVILFIKITERMEQKKN